VNLLEIMKDKMEEREAVKTRWVGAREAQTEERNRVDFAWAQKPR
jgi:hypothetical protein